MNRQYYTILIILAVFVSSEAFAKKSRRRGLNFGSGVSFSSISDNLLPTEINSSSRKTKQDSQYLQPYVAYSASGVLNFGLSLGLEDASYSEKESFTDNTSIDRAIEKSTQSANLFGRFMFANILYFEAGFGAYKEETKITTTSTNVDAAGTFAGAVDSETIKGSGPGYHLGAGFEVPTGGGFYFTGSYISRFYQIYNGDNALGRDGNKRSYQLNKRLTFGMSYYYN